MTDTIRLFTFSSLLLCSSSFAGEEVIPPVIEKEPSKDISNIFDFSVNARLRYEFREQGNLDASHAGTLRVRPGITLLPNGPFSVFVESEHTIALIDDYQVGTPQSAILEPFTANNTPIGDPENNELNQAYAQFKKDGFTAKVGRQRYILDNAAFIGNVGWRQNEQTLDAASIAYKGKDYALSYAYANRVNRIFGTDGNSVVQALEGDVHLFNGSKKFGEVTVGAYAYLLDFDEAPANGFANRASSNTYGAYVKYDGLHAEFAFQQDGGDSTLDRDSTYAHVYYTKKAGEVTLTGGVEYLEAEFYTPLATVHAFNGFADRFIANRLGLADSPGITDFYAVAATKVNDVTLKGFAHYYSDDSLSQDFGWEVDFVAVKPIFKGAKLLAKLAYYNGGVSADDEIKQASVQIDYSF